MESMRCSRQRCNSVRKREKQLRTDQESCCLVMRKPLKFSCRFQTSFEKLDGNQHTREQQVAVSNSGIRETAPPRTGKISSSTSPPLTIRSNAQYMRLESDAALR